MKTADDAMPDPDDFAKFLDGITYKISDEARQASFDRAVEEAIRVVRAAAQLRVAGIDEGFSEDTAEAFAYDFWAMASGLDCE
ncbi:hypothetical protein ACFU99_00590 [Streptomyces sp. NPDC057654]|uniref:hypothetical protein n=1 Tax=Streptomyces sp. NPDC057654 TaxID=3346196 RepID=UPI0036C6C621